MSIKRRKFVQTLLVATPVAPAIAAAQQPAPPPSTAQQQPPPQANTPANQVPRQPTGIPKLPVTQPDLTAETRQKFFNADQYAALEKLGAVLVPPLKGNPGAVDAQAPEFLDFLISESLPDKQKLYRDGLDHLNAQAKSKFQKPFAQLDKSQVDAIVRPLLVARPWPQDLPSDPQQNFIAQAHEDLRTATMNSREWADARAKTGGTFMRRFRGAGMYWAPIDPIVGN